MSAPTETSITLRDELSPEELRAIEDGLSQSAKGIPPRKYRPLALLCRDAEGAIVAGLSGSTAWGWLHVRLLWVAESRRGSGLGRELLRRAEDEARARGCRHVVLDTFSFQAQGFYEKLGYTVFGTLEDFPPGHRRLYLRKALGEDPGSSDG